MTALLLQRAFLVDSIGQFSITLHIIFLSLVAVFGVNDRQPWISTDVRWLVRPYSLARSAASGVSRMRPLSAQLSPNRLQESQSNGLLLPQHGESNANRCLNSVFAS
jgi:hypothetical protein